MKKFESIYIDGLETFINERLTQRPFPILFEMEEFAKNNKIPILSPAAGSVLKFLISLLKPKKVLELGTGLGYSTSWMLSAGIPIEIYTLDRNARELKSAESFLNQIILETQKIHFVETHCLEFLKKTGDLHSFDLVFVDCDKICYPEILELLSQKTKPETHLLFDNVLWHGRLEESKHTKPSDKAIQDFCRQVQFRKLNYTLFPSGDGLLLIS